MPAGLNGGDEVLQAESYSERRKRGYPLKNPIRRILGLFGDDGRPKPYDLNLEAARIIMEREARRIRADPHDEEALQYFSSAEFQRWFEVPAAVIIELIRSLPTDRFSYALKHIKPRSEASQKALDSF